MHRLLRIAGLFVVLILLFGATGCGRTVPPGAVGVYFNWRTGTAPETTLTEGWNWLAPWNRIYMYDVRVKDKLEQLKVLTNDQLNVATDVSIRYRPMPSKVGYLHQEVGPDFYDVLISPTLRNIAREVMAEFSSMEAYAKRNAIQERIQEGVVAKLADKHIEVEQIMLRNMDFPKAVSEAIERKLAMKQEAEKMKFVLEKEQLEAERKRVEAKGIADFQEIVTKGINENLLRWKGIEATNALAQSNNAKVVVIGSAKDGLPIILGK